MYHVTMIPPVTFQNEPNVTVSYNPLSQLHMWISFPVTLLKIYWWMCKCFCLWPHKQEVGEEETLQSDHQLNMSSALHTACLQQLKGNLLYSIILWHITRWLLCSVVPLPTPFMLQKQIYLFTSLRKNIQGETSFCVWLKLKWLGAPFFNATQQRKKSHMQTVPQED